MKPISRRKFIFSSLAALPICGQAQRCLALWPFNREPADIRGNVFRGDAPDKPGKWSHQAIHYQKLENSRVMCALCPHRCRLAPGDRGVCRARANIGGVLYSLSFGNPCSVNLDPIEKKPLYHFMPGSRAFSLAVAGCNLRCLNCQNWEISQVRPSDVRHLDLSPSQIVEAAVQADAQSIAYTYSEPISFYEYMTAIAKLARQSKLYNLWISAGYINPGPLKQLCGLIDGANVNLKAFDDAVYRKLNGARLDPILNTFVTLNRHKVHFEMTHLVVPGYVDKPEMVRAMCQWILDNLGPDHPLHFNRFFPRYKLTRIAPTPISTLTEFRQIALDAGIHYVYVGNVPGHEGNHTYCWKCGKRIIERHGFGISAFEIENGQCRFCGNAIAGVWSGDDGRNR